METAFRFITILLTVLAVSACTDRSYTPVLPEALSVGRGVTILAGTTRVPEDDGNFGYRRARELRFLEMTVSIPPTHQPGHLDFGYANPNPYKQFTLAGQTRFDSADAFQGRLNSVLAALPQGEREVTVFVHGYNTTQAETAFRAAQLANDIQLPGAVVIYSWPSRGRALAYAYDNDSVLYARDGLEQLLRQVAGSGAKRVLLVAHSIGSALSMETLRQIEISSPGWPANKLSGVILISPDLDVQVFRSQIRRLSQVPQPFIVFVSQKDTILNLSQRLRGTDLQQRLGSINNVDLVADLPVEIVDTTAFSDGAGSSHFIPATSPALIALLLRARSVSSTFREEQISLTSVLTGRPETAPVATKVYRDPANTLNR